MTFSRMMTFDRQAACWLVLAPHLADGTWHTLTSLKKVAEDELQLTGPAAGNVLTDAYREGYLEKRFGAKKARYYRVTDEGRRRRPELRVP